ncbi:hypothetical protein H0H92_011001 [Tricholoma furcatifolium]|nr:hypothetical protein H0H92_011001 [Tricholoma furcatifolium]
MNTTSWDNYGNGDDLQRHHRNRSSTVATAHSNVPMSLMPGRMHPSHHNTLPNFYSPAASRRMSIADDIRNAHNIPLAPPVPPLPPLYPSYAGTEFQPRPAPPVPSSTPPPPLPPLPPSLATSAYIRASNIAPPPIPPKPFSWPNSSSHVPRALMPGGRTLEPIEDESDLAIAMALSASASKEEQSLRQMLASQEEEDMAKALEASMLETGPPAHRDDVFVRDPSPPTMSQSSFSQGHEDPTVEALAHSLDDVPSSGSLDNPYLGHSDSVLVGPSVLGEHEKLPTVSLQPSSMDSGLLLVSDLPAKPNEIPSVSPGAELVPSIPMLSVEDAVSVPSPSTPSSLAYLHPEDEQDETITPRGDSEASHTNVFYSSPTALPSQLPEATTNQTSPSTNLYATVTSGETLDHRDAFQCVTVDSLSTSSQGHFQQTFNTTPDLPEYSPRADLPFTLPADANAGRQESAHDRELHATPEDSSFETSRIVHSSEGGVSSEPMPPSYAEAHAPIEDPPIPNSTYVTDASSIPNRTRAQSHVQTSRPLSTASAHTSTSRSSSASVSSSSTIFSRPSSVSTASSINHSLPHPTSHTDLRIAASARISRIPSSESVLDAQGDDLDSARPSPNHLNLSAFVSRELLLGVSVGFMAPKISSQLVPMTDDMPPIISLPYGKARPLHLQGQSWRHLLKLMASLSGTRMEASLDAIAATKSAPRLRTVIQFLKPQHASSVWRTIFYFTIDYPAPQPQIRHRSVNDLPYSYSLTGPPTLLRDASDSPISKVYTIPASDSMPYPTLPISFPDLAMYMQATLDESRRYLHDSHSDYRKLAKMVTACYPDEDLPQAPAERRGLLMRVMGLSNKAPKRSGNEDTYEFVTPFVTDELEWDQVILSRITNDERPLRRVIKKFHAYTSLSHSPLVPPIGNTTDTSLDDAREAFLVELATFELSLKKSAMICEAEARQVDEYQQQRQEIEQEHEVLREQITQLKAALDQAQLVRRRKMEYDLVAEKVNTLPSREELEHSINSLESDMTAIRDEHESHNRTLLDQKSSLDAIITQLDYLRFMGKDKDVPSTGPSRVPSPVSEPSGADVAEDTDSAALPEVSSERDGDRKPTPESAEVPTETGEDDIEMGEVEEDPELKKQLQEEREEGEASDASSALSDPPDD